MGVAAQLVLRPKMVRNHVSISLGKLQLGDLVETMQAACAAGVGQEPKELRAAHG
jgi:hypothetical protein